LVALLFWGCGTAGHSVKTPPIADLALQKHTEELNEAMRMSALQQPAANQDYVVGAEDLLEISAYNVDELSKTVRVNSQGEIALPLVGILNVRGLTTTEIEQLISKKLAKYVQETVVTVYVKEYKSQSISVLGEVNKPDTFAVTGQRHLLQMLMMAGGLTKDAGSTCYIIRPALTTDHNSRSMTMVIDLDELLVKGNSKLNVPVFSGDVINVSRGNVFFLDGSVKTPGVYPMKGGTSLVQAISMAQGANPDASLSDIRIYRANDKGGRDIIDVNYNAILKGDKPDVFIAENDIIIVPQSGVKNFFYRFLNTIRGALTFGGVGVGM
jgi:polysaccharide export outer membrane protein